MSQCGSNVFGLNLPIDTSNHLLLGGPRVFFHDLHNPLVRVERGMLQLGLVEGVMDGNSLNSGDMGAHLRSSLSSVNFLVQGDQMWQFKSTSGLGEEEAVGFS